jgi:hypothetical protein
MKIGISVRIDVTKIDKAKLYQGNKGTYLNMTTYIDTEEVDQYGDNGFISQSVSKEERENGEKGRILGNCKLFYNEQQNSQGGVAGRSGVKTGIQSAESGQSSPQATNHSSQSGFDDDIPF